MRPNPAATRGWTGDGWQRTNFGGFDGAAGVALQANGRIVAAGVGLGTDFTSDFALARYLGGWARWLWRNKKGPATGRAR